MLLFSASTIAENGRKTCLKLKVFVRPSSKCLHATQGFSNRAYWSTQFDWKSKQFTSTPFPPQLPLWSLSNIPFYVSQGCCYSLRKCFMENLIQWWMITSNEIRGTAYLIWMLPWTLLLGCLMSGLRGGLQMSLTYLADTSNDLSFSLFSVIDSCVKTIGVHDRVFDVNDKVDNTLEPRG